MIENNFTADEYQIIDITSFIKKQKKQHNELKFLL